MQKECITAPQHPLITWAQEHTKTLPPELSKWDAVKTNSYLQLREALGKHIRRKKPSLSSLAVLYLRMQTVAANPRAALALQLAQPSTHAHGYISESEANACLSVENQRALTVLNLSKSTIQETMQKASL